MECRKITFKFKRQLSYEEECELISYFKGLILKMKDTLRGKRKTLEKFGWIAAKFNQQQVRIIEERIDTLLKPDEKGRCILDGYFSLDFEVSEPLLWHFTYPHPQTIFGMAGVMGQMRKHGINTDAEDRLVFRNLVNQAGLARNLEEMTVGIVERELK